MDAQVYVMVMGAVLWSWVVGVVYANLAGVAQAATQWRKVSVKTVKTMMEVRISLMQINVESNTNDDMKC